MSARERLILREDGELVPEGEVLEELIEDAEPIELDPDEDSCVLSVEVIPHDAFDPQPGIPEPRGASRPSTADLDARSVRQGRLLRPETLPPRPPPPPVEDPFEGELVSDPRAFEADQLYREALRALSAGDVRTAHRALDLAACMDPSEPRIRSARAKLSKLHFRSG